MKLSIVATIVSLSSAVATTPVETFRPYRIDFNDLKDGNSFQNARSSFVDALSRVGMVAVTNVPFTTKHETLTLLHECAMESAATLKHTYQDGTVRHTMATHTVPGGMQAIHHDTNACDGFSKASDDLRQTVAAVVEAFVLRLNSVLDLEDKTSPLLTTSHGYPFTSLVDVVESGEHLEHFHSYQRTSNDTTSETIDFHVDQGMFIAFVPALLVSAQEVSEEKVSAVSDGFLIQLQDGSRAMVKFEADDDLVFMVGDGINQVVNPRLSKESLMLRAIPHALTMPNHGAEEARVWYGRMVLPPSEAVHPNLGVTFDDIRQGMIEADGEEKLSLGCSSSMTARKLQATECLSNNTIYCWEQCMNATEYFVSASICASRRLNLRCINPRSQLYVTGYGDFYPGCIDASTAGNNTDYPPLDNSPRKESTCTLARYQAFASNSSKYQNQVGMGNATLSWSVTNGVLDGRLAFNGLFGWLGFGLAKAGGGLNGMLGASVIMALPGGNYSAATGLDRTIGNTITEYMISPNQSAFRVWSDPVLSVSRSAATKQYAVEANDCFTAITFKTSSINNMNFNLKGKDRLIWGADDTDYFGGYHGSNNRAVFTVDWTTNIVTDKLGNELTTMTPNGPVGGTSSLVTKSAGFSAATLCRSVTMMLIAGVMMVSGFVM